MAATGGAPPYSYSITAGALLTGLTLNGSTGAITGTPSTYGSCSLSICSMAACRRRPVRREAPPDTQSCQPRLSDSPLAGKSRGRTHVLPGLWPLQRPFFRSFPDGSEALS